MSHLLDVVAFAIVLICALYAMRALLPGTLLARFIGNSTGNRIAQKKSGSCGDCDGCAAPKTDDGCH